MKKKVIDQRTMKSLQLTELKNESPKLTGNSKTVDIETYDRNLLISVGRGHGGLYMINPFQNKIQRKHKGIFAGLINYKNGFMALKQPNKLCIYDNRLNLKRTQKVQEDSAKGLHDLRVSEDGFIYIVSSPGNKIIILNEKTLATEHEVVLSTTERDAHHINDICIIGDTLLVSMFSVSGSWEDKQPAQWDGAVVAFDRRTFVPKGIILEGLTAPHSITLNNGSLYFCDSLKLNVSKFDLDIKKKKIIAQFTGFTRGLCFDNNVLIVGQSKMRHLQRMNDQLPGISFNGGIHLHDLKKHASRFINLPVGNPYAIVPY